MQSDITGKKSQSAPKRQAKKQRANDPARMPQSDELVLPKAEETEREVLGIFLFAPDSLQKAIECGLSLGLFALKSHQMIFSAMKAIHEKGQHGPSWSLTPKSLIDYLSSQHMLDKVGGGAYLSSLIDGRVSGPERLAGLIQQLKDVDYKRQAMKKGVELQNLAGNGASPAEIEEFLDTIPRTHTTVQSYSLTPTGLIYRKPAKFGIGFEAERLTNFGAKIVAELIEDDGSADERRLLDIEVTLKGETKRIEVAVSKFQMMQWPLAMIGSEAIVFPNKADQARCAIQTLSPHIQKRTVYAHTGWRKIDDQWCLLHGGGAIAGDGNRTDLSVRLPDALRNFILPDPATGDEITDAYQSVLEFLYAFPSHITLPVIGAVVASILGDPDYSVYLTGLSGSFKSEMTALAMSFFGSKFRRLHLPTNWESTSNSILELGFTAKDILVVIDDFAPTGQKHVDERLHAKAGEVFRAAGNRSAKGKLGVDHKQRNLKEPRCLYMASGEDLPKVPSIQFRLYIVPIKKGEIEAKELSAMQKMAKDGKFALSLATFINYVARNYEMIHSRFERYRILFRDKLAATNKGHSREPDMKAHLLSAWRIWLKAACAEKAISVKVRKSLWATVWQTLGDTAQTEYQTASNPADHFLALMRSALFAGHAHLQSPEGKEPPDISRICGWRSGLPLGDLVGIVDGGIIYLDPDNSYIAANSQGMRANEALAVSRRTLWKQMDEQKMIVKKEKGYQARAPITRQWSVAIATTLLFDQAEDEQCENS
jgi:hypothetical protein